MQLTLGACSYQAADPGEALATAGRIRDGDANGWFEEWQQTADRVRAVAEECAAAGRRVSARGAYLRAATYYANALYVIDATEREPRASCRVWMAHRGCFDRFADLCDPPLERVEIPYEGDDAPRLRSCGPGPADEPRPTVILNNGSDGPDLRDVGRGRRGGAGPRLPRARVRRPRPGSLAVPAAPLLPARLGARRHPGRRLPARPAPTSTRSGSRSPASARAATGCHGRSRSSTASPPRVADPGVVRREHVVGLGHLPPQHAPAPRPRRAGEVRPRHGVRREGLEGPPRRCSTSGAAPTARARPYEAFRAVQEYTLGGVVEQITCPMLMLRSGERAVLARPVPAALRRARMPEDDRRASPPPRAPTATASRSRPWCATSASSTGSTRPSPRSSRPRPANRRSGGASAADARVVVGDGESSRSRRRPSAPTSGPCPARNIEFSPSRTALRTPV